MKPWVPKGWTGKLLLVGEAPGEDEDNESRRPFTGRSGKLLRALWREAGYSDIDVAITNAIRCRPRNNVTPSMSQVRACRAFVLRVISQLKPQTVIGLGTTALRSLSNSGTRNVTDTRGRLIQVPGLEGTSSVYVSYHPAAILRGAHQLKPRILEDLRRPMLLEISAPIIENPEGKTLALDSEFTKEGSVVTVGLSDRRKAYAWETDWGELGLVLSGARRIVGHSVAQDIAKIAQVTSVKEKWITGEDTLDTLLLARMVDENGQSYELENLLLSAANVKPWKEKTQSISIYSDDWPVDLRMERCRLDAWAAALLAERYLPHLRNCRPLVTYTHKVASVLERVGIAGAMVDIPVYQSFTSRIRQEMLEAEDLVLKAAAANGMSDFVPTNDNHVRELLYRRLGLTPQNKTYTGLPSVDKVSLQNLTHEVATLLIRFNKVEKLWSTYGPGIAEYYHPCGVVDGTSVGYLPFRINPLGARTGRRSSSKPNSQNWPKDFRPIIRSRYPGGIIGDFDYSKLEVVLIAWVSGEEKLYDYFSSGNGYIDVAKEMWGFDIHEDTAEYRATKSIVLGVHYNMGSTKMASQLWNLGIKFSADYSEHVRKTDHLRRTYLRRFQRIRNYMEERERELLRNGMVRSLTGRVRHLPLPNGRDTEGFSHALNQAINFPIQSLAADVTGSALIDIESEILAIYGLDYANYLTLLIEWQKKMLTNFSDCDIILPVEMPVIINEVHDDIVVDMPAVRSKETVEIVVESMRAVKSLRKLVPAFDIPLSVGVKLNNHWYKDL